MINLLKLPFHFRHEHLYEKIERKLIRSDDFANDIVGTERLLLGSRVLLCTISMLSNMKLGTFSRLVPPQTVIFDEASQIEIGDYFPMLTRFRSTLRKLVFIGDDKQCGSEDMFPSLVIHLSSSGAIWSERHTEAGKYFRKTTSPRQKNISRYSV
jgi:hypothetical protein